MPQLPRNKPFLQVYSHIFVKVEVLTLSTCQASFSDTIIDTRSEPLKPLQTEALTRTLVFLICL